MYIRTILEETFYCNKYFKTFDSESKCQAILDQTPEDVKNQQTRLPNMFPKWPDELTALHRSFHTIQRTGSLLAKKHFFIMVAKYLADKTAKDKNISPRGIKFNLKLFQLLDTSKIKIIGLAQYIFKLLYCTDTDSGYEADSEPEEKPSRALWLDADLLTPFTRPLPFDLRESETAAVMAKKDEVIAQLKQLHKVSD